MSRISTYEVVPVPKLADKLIGTSVGGEIEDITYNFTLGELLNLFIPNIPASGLQGVLDIGNTATQNINLFGIITTTNLEVTDTANLFITYLNEETHIVGSVYDSYDFVGTAGDVLTSTGAGVEWVTLPPIFTPNLQQVLEVGNTADIDIILDANIVALDINVDTETVNNNITIDGTITDGYSSIGTSNQVLSSTGTKVKWVNLPAYSAISPLFFNNITGVFSIQKADSTHDGYLSYLDWITFDGKQNAGNYITALTGEATASGPGSASIILNNSSVTSKVLTGLNVTGGSISAADSILTAFGKVQSQLNGLVGGLYFKGSWNALINNPTLTSSVGTQGWYYIVSVAGNTNLNGITDWQVGDWAIFNGATWDKIDNTDLVTSVNGQIGAVNLTTDNIPEGTTNLYYLNSRARAAISLTTIGVSGAATYNNVTGVLNIPAYLGGVSSFNTRTGAVVPTEGDYTLTQLGDVTITTPTTGQVLKYNGTIWINDTDANTGTVTSVAMSVPTGLSVSGSPITSSGTLAVTYSSGYSIPTTASQSDWDTAYTNRITSLTTTGTSGAATLIANVLNIPNYSPDLSGYVPNTRTLTINGTGYDLSANRSWSVGTVTSVAALTLGTSGTDLSSTVATGTTTPVITLNVPTSSATNRGVLSSADWTTFNNKANALSGTTNTVPKFTSSITIGDSNIKDNGNVVSVSATAGSFGALQVGNYNGNILMNTTNASGGLIFQNTSSSNKLWDFSSYNNDINFNESGIATPVMTLKSGGNIGINTTTPSNRLDIIGTLGATGVVTLGNLAGSGNRMVIADSLGVLSTQTITTGTVTAVTASSPLFSSGGNTPNITIQQSSGSQNGYLSSTDWTTFNNKQASGNYITSLTGEATGTGPGATAVTLNNAAVTGKVLTGINITGGTVVDTDSILTGFGKLQNQINSLIGSTIYKGTWNASTNTPTLTSGVGTRGWYYIVSVAGTTNLDGISDWFIGDWAIFDGTAWQQVDNTDAVVSVNGQTGAVSLTTDNIPEGTTNLYFLNSRARAALSFTAGSGAYNSTTGVITIPTNTSQLTNGANFITLASLSGTSPIVYNNTTGAISITQSSTSTNGYLSSTDWNTFNGKQSTITLTTTGTSGAATFTSNTLNIPQYQAAGTYVTSVTGTSPIVSSGGITPAISIPVATTSVNGYLSSTDWTTFNNKQSTITLTTTGTSGAATFISNVLNIPNYGSVLTGYVPYTGATTNVDLGAFNLTSTDVTANGNVTLYGNLTGTKTVSSGSPYSLTVTQNSTNTTDTGDGALSVNHVLSGSGTGTELVTRSFIFSSNNSRTGGSVLTNSRVLYLVSSTQSSTNTTNLDQVYIEGGTMAGTVTNNRGVLVKTMQGTNQAAFVATGLTSSNRVHLLLGNYTLPTGAWGIYSALTDPSYLQGNLLLASATDDGVNKLQVTGATKITGQLTLGSTITNGTYTYTLPSATGTLALTSQLTSGTVTSVATSGTVSGITLTGGTITTTGTITLGGTLSVLPSNFASQTANTVLAAPNGSAGVPTFRALVAADIPSLSGSYLPLAGGTLTGALNGTSASFSSSITTSGGGFIANMSTTNTPALTINRASTSYNGIIKFQNGASDTWILGNRNTGDETFRLYNYNVGADVLIFANTGAATFSGDVTNKGTTYFGASSTGDIFVSPSTGYMYYEYPTSYGAIFRTQGGGQSLQLNASGTAVFSSSVTSNALTVSNSSNAYLQLSAGGTGGSEAGIFFANSGNKWENYTAANDTALNWYSYANSTIVFKIASTGAATFSSSVTAGGLITGQNSIYQSNASGQIASNNWGVYNGGATDMNFAYNASGTFTVQNGTNRFQVASTGATTFIGNGYFPSKMITLAGAEPTRYSGNIGLNLIGGSQLGMSFGTRSNNTDYDNTLNLYNGNVGIGTTSPAAKLDISSTAVQDGIGINAVTYPQLTLAKGGVLKSYIAIAGVANGYGTGTLTDSLVIRNVGAIHMMPNDGVISTTFPISGNVLIGTTTDNGNKLQVYGTISNTSPSATPLYVQNVLLNASSTSGSTGIYIGDAGSGVITLTREKQTANTARTAIYSEYGYNTQTLGAYFYNTAAYQGNNSATWSISSDERVKENIIIVSNAINIIEQLKPITFDYKDDFAKNKNWDNIVQYNNIGFIAQDFEKVLPKYVHQTFEKINNETISDFKTIDTGQLIPLLVAAVQEQQQQIKELQAQINK